MDGRFLKAWRSGRGIIATLLLFLATIPGGCKVSRANRLKVANQEYAVSQAEDELSSLRHQLFRTRATIAQLQADIASEQVRLDAVETRSVPAARELAESLRVLKRMEEDLVAAGKRRTEVAGQLAAAKKLDAEIAAKQKEAAAATKSRDALREKLVAVNQEVSELTALLSDRQDLAVRLRALLTAAGVPSSQLPQPAPVPETTPKPKDPAKTPAKTPQKSGGDGKSKKPTKKK